MNKCLQWISLTALQMALIVSPWDSPRNNTCVKVSTNKSLAEHLIVFGSNTFANPYSKWLACVANCATCDSTQRNCWTQVQYFWQRGCLCPLLSCDSLLDQPMSNRSNTFADFAKFDQRFSWTRSLVNMADREVVPAPYWVEMPFLISPCPTSPTVALRTMSVSTNFVGSDWRAGF